MGHRAREVLQESNPHRALGCGDRGPGPRACSRFKGAPSASSSCCAKDADGRFPRDASSTLEVTPAAAPVPSHPPHGPPPPDHHSQWRAAPRPAEPPRAPAPANLRPPGGARRATGCQARPSDPRPAHLLRSDPLHPASLPVTAALATTTVRRPRPRPRLPSPAGRAQSLHTGSGPARVDAYLSPTQLHTNEVPTPHSGAPNSRPRPGVWRHYAALPQEERSLQGRGRDVTEPRRAPAASGPLKPGLTLAVRDLPAFRVREGGLRVTISVTCGGLSRGRAELAASGSQEGKGP